METAQTTSSVIVDVIPAAPEQEAILANLLELYMHDFSEFVGLKLDANGRFGYERLPLYWKESNRYPFLIMVNGHWAGFVFVRKGSRISGFNILLLRPHDRGKISPELTPPLMSQGLVSANQRLNSPPGFFCYGDHLRKRKH
jgi:hypothetical protein